MHVVRRDDGFKLKEGRFLLDIKKKFFTMRVERHWNGLPKDDVEVPSLETFTARLDGALATQVEWKVSLLKARDLGQMIFRTLPTQTILRFCESMILSVTRTPSVQPFAWAGRLFSLYAECVQLRMMDFMQNSLTRHLISPGGKNIFYGVCIHSFIHLALCFFTSG